MFIGFWLAGNIYNKYELADGGHNWRMIWIIPAGIALIVLVLFGSIFKNEKLTIDNSSLGDSTSE
jgi:hypothetical protein